MVSLIIPEKWILFPPNPQALLNRLTCKINNTMHFGLRV